MAPDRAPDRAKRRPHGLDSLILSVLPDDTADDRPDPAEAESEVHDRWLRDNRPPHHDTGW